MASSGFSVAKVLEANGKKSLLGLLFSFEGLKMFADGNVAHNKLIKGPNDGKLMGTDHLGNRYYENEDLPYARKRWVVYQDTFDYSPSGIPSEWHGWLNGINDYPGAASGKYVKPIYAVESAPTKTGTSQAYLPKGSWFNAEKRQWKKFEAWQPPKA